LERREQRATVNRLLAEAYWKSGREEHRGHAHVSVRRAWQLSRFSPDLLPLYTEIHAALDDVQGIREAYKRVGMASAARGDVSGALGYFDLWQYANHTFKKLDSYAYDFDILECVDRLAQPHRLSPKPRADFRADGKLRVAYLVKGVTELGSVLVKMHLLYARLHDRSRVEPVFFVPEPEREVLASEAGREHVRLFESLGYKLVMAPNTGVRKDRLLAVARLIQEARPDLLVTGAALADFEHCFITSLRPAPFVMGFVLGPPEQFAPLTLDWGIAWSKHPLIDCPVSCALMDMELEMPERGAIVPYERRELGIPDDAVILGTAGRHVKFQDPGFWQAVIGMLAEHPRLYYLAMGVEESQVPFLPTMLTPEVRPRVRFLGWRGDDYLRALCLADIYLDTFPSGGGTVLNDAMSLAIPVVAFQNNYMKVFNQTDWSPADGFNMPEIVVPRGDFEQVRRVVSRLVGDREHRVELGRRCRERLRDTRANPERAVRRCEELYARVLGQELSGGQRPDPREAEIEGLASRLARPRNAPPWVAWTAHQLKRALRFGERVLDRVA
jgi:glycosyltransferase involved in cell wall biosynthesis